MKIVHVCITSNVFNKNYAYQDNLLAKHHALLGHKVSIMAPIYSEFDQQTGKIVCAKPGIEIIDNGITVYRLQPLLGPVIDKHVHWVMKFRTTIALINPDFIFVHGVISPNYRFFNRYKKLHPNVKIVFDSHADSVNSCHTFLSKIYSKYIVRLLIIPKIINVSEYFYGVTPARCLFLHEMYGVPKEKISFLPMGADDFEMHMANRDEIRREIRGKYCIADNDFLIVTGGKIDRSKNIHLLAESVNNSQYKNIKILIFGSICNELKPIFGRIQSNRVQYVGWVESNEVYNYFYAADLVMFPGLHSVLWEQAVASLVPCAFSRIKGFEHVDIGGNCIFLDYQNIDYYQQVIEGIYHDNIRYNRMKEVAQSYLCKQFLYSNIAKKVLFDIQNHE